VKKSLSLLVALALVILAIPVSSVIAQHTEEESAVIQDDEEVIILRALICSACKVGRMYDQYGSWSTWFKTNVKRDHLGVSEYELSRERDWWKRCDVCAWCLQMGKQFDDKWDCNH